MAPMPDDDDFGDDSPNDFPPHFGITKLPPSMVTSTYTKHSFTTTVAYFMGSWVDDSGSLHSYTISEFDELNDASAFAAGIGAMPTGDPWESIWSEYYSGYASVAPVTEKAQNYPTTPQTSYPTAAQTAIPSESPQNQQPHKEHKGPPVMVLAVSIIVPIIVCLVTITACIFCVSHYRRKARKVEAAGLANRMSSEMPEVGVGSSGPKPMGMRIANDERAYLAPPSSTPPRATTGAAAAGAGAAAVPLAAAGALGSQQDPPVILSTTMDNGFYTGIDTSEAISLSDQRSMASHDTFGEEPPPPYRPRSVPPISRETSVRTSIMSATLNRNSSIRSSHRETLSSGSIIRRSNEVRSPFDDPEEEDEEDDTVSEVSTVRGRVETDRLSLVSDLSYQDSPTRSRSHLS